MDPTWIPSPVLGPCASYGPPNMSTGEVDATPVATGRTGCPHYRDDLLECFYTPAKKTPRGLLSVAVFTSIVIGSIIVYLEHEKKRNVESTFNV